MIVYIVTYNNYPSSDKEIRIFKNIDRAIAYKNYLDEKKLSNIRMIKSELDECNLTNGFDKLKESDHNVYVEENNEAFINKFEDNSVTVAVLGSTGSGKTAMLTRIMGKNIVGKRYWMINPTYAHKYKDDIEYESTPTKQNCLYFHDTSYPISIQRFDSDELIEETVIDGNGISVKFIDTPGAKDFVQDRINAIDECDMAIIVTDIKNPCDDQTIECIKLLREKKIPFFIVLNKLDSISSWNDKDDGLSNDVREILRNEYKIGYQNFEKYLYEAIDSFGKYNLECIPNHELEEMDDIDIFDCTPLLYVSSFKKQGFSNITNWIELFHRRLKEDERIKNSFKFVKIQN